MHAILVDELFYCLEMSGKWYVDVCSVDGRDLAPQDLWKDVEGKAGNQPPDGFKDNNNLERDEGFLDVVEAPGCFGPG